MSFIYGSYFPLIIIAWVIFTLVVLIGERKFFKFVQTYWFLRRRWRHYLGTMLWLVGVLGLLLSLMDWRGPEERIKAQVPEDKTIILIVLYVKLEYIVDKYYSATNASMEVILIILKIGLLKYFIIINF